MGNKTNPSSIPEEMEEPENIVEEVEEEEEQEQLTPVTPAVAKPPEENNQMDPKIKVDEVIGLRTVGGYVPALCIFQKHDIILGGSSDNMIYVFKGKDNKYTKEKKDLHYHKKGVLCLLKWDEDTCISISQESTFPMFEVTGSREIVKKFEIPNSKTGNFLLKLNSELFLCLTYGGDLLVYNINNNYPIRTLNITLKIQYMKKLSLSKIFPNYFFVTTDSSGSVTKLIDWKESRIIHEFKKSTENIICMCNFLNNRKEEILGLGGNASTLFIFRSMSSKKDTEKDVKLLAKIPTGRQIYSMTNVANNYIVCCDSEGWMSLADVRTDNFRLVMKEKIELPKRGGVGGTWEAEVLRINSPLKKMSIILGSSSVAMVIVNISGVKFQNERILEMMENDITERTEFLQDILSQVDEELFIHKEEKIYKSIKLLNSEIDYVFPSLLSNM